MYPGIAKSFAKCYRLLGSVYYTSRGSETGPIPEVSTKCEGSFSSLVVLLASSLDVCD